MALSKSRLLITISLGIILCSQLLNANKGQFENNLPKQIIGKWRSGKLIDSEWGDIIIDLHFREQGEITANITIFENSDKSGTAQEGTYHLKDGFLYTDVLCAGEPIKVWVEGGSLILLTSDSERYDFKRALSLPQIVTTLFTILASLGVLTFLCIRKRGKLKGAEVLKRFTINHQEIQ